jgi:CPA1 family monovalent cation:H+ antiporter
VVGGIVLVVAGGGALGALIGFLAGKLSRQIPDSLTCLMLTTIVAYGTYILAERLQMSGVIATVTAGLVFRGTAWTQELSPGTRLAMLSFWEFAGFLVNSVVFLLLGFAIRLHELWRDFLPILWGLLAIHGARVLTVYPLMQAGRPLGTPVPAGWQHVMVFANIKGAVSAAMALLAGRLVADPSDPTDTLPLDFATHQMILNITIGLVLITLLSQGLFLSRFLRLLGLGAIGRRDIDLQQLQLRLLTARTALHELDRLHEAGLLTALNYGQLRSRYRLAVAQAEEGLQQMEVEEQLGQSAVRVIATQRHLLTVEKSAVLDAVRDKIVAEEAAGPLLQKLDEQLLALNRQLDQH